MCRTEKNDAVVSSWDLRWDDDEKRSAVELPVDFDPKLEISVQCRLAQSAVVP